MKFTALFVFLALQSHMLFANHYPEVKVTGIRSPEINASFSYYIQLLELVLNKTAPKGIQRRAVSQDPMVPSREVKQLELGKLDVVWGGTSIERENKLQAIRIPLLRGLLGYRVSLIHKDSLAQFDKITQLEELLKFHPCQAADWPDTKILKHAGFDVIENTGYIGLFKQLNAKRCDLFPRAIYEADSEFELVKKQMPDLRLYQKLIIQYPFPMYFFVQKGNDKLEKILTDGLEKAIDDGSFDHLLKTHEVTAHLFPLEKWKDARYIKLDNPVLPKGTDTRNPRYWMDLEGRQKP